MRARFFQQRDDLLALYAWESLEKILNRVSRLQMIEQTSHRHPSTDKDRIAAKHVGILGDNAAHERNTTIARILF